MVVSCSVGDCSRSLFACFEAKSYRPTGYAGSPALGQFHIDQAGVMTCIDSANDVASESLAGIKRDGCGRTPLVVYAQIEQDRQILAAPTRAAVVAEGTGRLEGAAAGIPEVAAVCEPEPVRVGAHRQL